MKFSIIVPVYNVEKYLRKCLDSIINQTYSDYEVIVVNDGSPDNSGVIIEEYKEKYPNKIKAYNKENGGLSDARNFGMQYTTGDYVIFVDSDDYIKENMLEVLNNNIKDNEDVIGYNLITVDSNYNNINIAKRPSFDIVSGEEAIIKLIEGRECFEPACVYAYNLKYWKSNKFQFEVGRYHEDFGLIPEVIAKAKKVKQLDYHCYYYLQNSNSITKNKSIALKKANDVLYYYNRLINVSNNMKNIEAVKYLKSYSANAVLVKLSELEGTDKTKYAKEILEQKVCDNLLDNTLARKVKKVICKIKLKNVNKKY